MVDFAIMPGVIGGIIGLLVGLVVAAILYNTGKKHGVQEFTIEISPFYRSEKTGILGFQKNLVEIGFTHQLLVRGFPCMKPIETIVETKEVKELNQEELFKIINNAVDVVTAIQSGGVSRVLKAPVAKHLRS